ncbi:hypothetical protein ACIBCN_19375 [Nocardia sp. NPDC051052]|uniref:hypothetical protein n=1 Tax=Nocardia sp. NPDC051052 TaxID=3364322 RepID=UPI0037A133CE
MQPSGFFKTERDSSWSMNGDPWAFREVLNSDLVAEIAKGAVEKASDLDVAHALTQLVHDELRGFGTDSVYKLTNDEISVALRALRAVLRRLGLEFKPPFRDFSGFHDYWSREGMSGPGGWAARRGYLSVLFEPIWNGLSDLDEVGDASTSARGVDGHLKNIIFASSGPKPEIVLRDAVNNVVEIVKFADRCLVYDKPLPESGLAWGDLVTWWGGLDVSGSDLEKARSLYRRLDSSLGDNSVERIVFRTYCENYRGESGLKVPALLPQVYLHFDPLTGAERRTLGKPNRLRRERMDFLLLLPDHVRIVIEVDGKQHYANGDKASPQEYAKMVAEDRALRLRGYEVFRFGGYELMQPDAPDMLRRFFADLFSVHGILER